MENATPMLRQYTEIKRQYPGTILFFRLGDFYEMFFEDAEIGSRELEITLTARHRERGAPVPMCGVPYHAAAGYIAKLVRKGYRVAICEQTEDPKKATKLVKREVIRVITPGTAIDPQLLDARDNNYLAALAAGRTGMGIAFLDVSTGEFLATEFAGEGAWRRALDQIESFAPAEIIFPQSLAPLFKRAADPGSAGESAGNAAGPDLAEALHAAPLIPRSARPAAAAGQVPSAAGSSTGGPADAQSDGGKSQTQSMESDTLAVPRPGSKTGLFDHEPALTPLDEWRFAPDQAADLLRSHFCVLSLEGFGLDGHDLAIGAAGAALGYAHETQKAAAAHVTGISYFESSDYMTLDGTTSRNLELVESLGGSREHTLLGVLDQSMTSMGARLLKHWILRPSLKQGELNARLAAVAELKDATILRDRLRAELKRIADLERLIGRVNLGRAGPRDIVALKNSAERIPPIKELLADATSSLLEVLGETMDELSDLREMVSRSLVDDAPVSPADGGYIRQGYDAELDELRGISLSSKSTIAGIETRERERTGIGSLKVKFNNVFGYFIEVSKSNLKNVPDHYERRQTLTGAERYTTPELKEYEGKVLGAEERILEIEQRIFSEIRELVSVQTRRVQSVAAALATLDIIQGLAEAAARRGYCRPVLTESDTICVRAGRHPMVEAAGEKFIPNDLFLNNSTDRLLIVTGPNMGGKSVYLRQAALIVIMAQIGSFVPASEAEIALVDRVFTRVGASDSLARGRSTFMVEMSETANILNTATPRSLILLDEVGRGTATFDGLSLAWAIAEYLHDDGRHAAKTLFATHYHEMTELARLLPGVRNYQMAVKESGGSIVFLRRVVEGSASKSYGIEVARLAGLPKQVIDRAREILGNLEANELDVSGRPKLARHLPSRPRRQQPDLFQAANQTVVDELRNLEADQITGDEALAALRKLQEKLI